MYKEMLFMLYVIWVLPSLCQHLPAMFRLPLHGYFQTVHSRRRPDGIGKIHWLISINAKTNLHPTCFRFPDEYCCPLYIDPVDPLFKKVGQLFLQKIIAEYGGTNHIYFSDPFNEMQPRLADAKYLSDASLGIYETMKIVDADAVWLLQGWMFVKNPFWSDELLKAFLTAVPKGRMLVLDLQSENYPQYSRTNSFYGQPYIWCMLHNFGGTLGMHGSVDVVNTVC